jgi:hypothetical protein
VFGVLVALMAGAAPAWGFSPVEGVQFSGQIGTLLIACHANSGASETFNCAVLPASETATIIWGDGVTDTGPTAVKDPNDSDCSSTTSSTGTCRYLISGTHIYAEEGSYSPVKFSAPNVNGPPSNNPAHGTTSATVADAALTNPTGATGLAATEGAPASLTLGSFKDASPGGAAGDFSATIDWGDGTTTDGTVTSSAGGFSVSGMHTFAHAGSPSVTVAVHDDGGSSATFAVTVTVADAPLTATPATGLSTAEGTARKLTLANFSDADPGATASLYSATIHWGDGTTGSATVTSIQTGGFSVSATHTYKEEGVKTGSVTIRDAGGASTSAKISIHVSDAALTLHLLAVHGTAGRTIHSRLASFTDADPRGAAGDYKATINWGDGSSPTTGSVSPNGSGGFAVAGSHAYMKAGSYRVKVTVKDTGGATASKSEQVTIARATAR